MLQRSISLITATLALAVAPVALHAQEDGRPASDRYTVAGAVGGVSGPDQLNQAGAPAWRQGWSGSLDATYWLNRHWGVRAGSTLAQDRARGATIDGAAFNKLTYDASVVLRAPRRAGEGTLIPYVVAGAGAITVHPIGSGGSWTKPAGNVGAGVEYRFQRLGVRAEARDYVYEFDRYGYDHTQNQVAWQGGVTLSF
jgi:outer membrane protein with beta-barrel domain